MPAGEVLRRKAGTARDKASQRKRRDASSDPAVENLGERLRTIRVQRGLSQRALAKRAGVPSSSVSLIESGQVSPSIGSLKRLLDGVGLSLAEFFSFDLPTVTDQVFFRQQDLSEIIKGKFSYRQVGTDLRNRALQIACETYQPGADSGRVPLSHEGQEGGIVIEGCLEVTVGNRKRVLKAGDAYLFNSTTPHRFRNPADVVCVMISACTPPTF